MLKIDEGYQFVANLGYKNCECTFSVILNKRQLSEISHFYHVAMIQEYLVENYILTEEKAEIMAEEVVSAMDKYLMSEEEAIKFVFCQWAKQESADPLRYQASMARRESEE